MSLRYWLCWFGFDLPLPCLTIGSTNHGEMCNSVHAIEPLLASFLALSEPVLSLFCCADWFIFLIRWVQCTDILITITHSNNCLRVQGTLILLAYRKRGQFESMAVLKSKKSHSYTRHQLSLSYMIHRSPRSKIFWACCWVLQHYPGWAGL